MIPAHGSERWQRLAWLMGYEHPPGVTLDQLDELKRYIAFSADDEACLRSLRPMAEPVVARMATHFYDAIRRSDQAHRVFRDEAQIERLHGSMQRWILALLSGPWDGEWAARSRHVGQVHVRVGLPERYMFVAMNLIREELCELAHEHFDWADARATCRAVRKVTDLELCLMTGAYHEAHEDAQLRGLQQLIVENLPVNVLVLDAAGRVTSATRPQGRIFADDAGPGLPYTAFLPPELVVAADLDTHIRTALATGVVQELSHVVLPGPPARHFRITIVPLEHELARLLLHVEELTDVLAAQHRASQAENLARIGAMAAQLAHEIRNPIAGISGTLQVIVNGMDASDRRAQILGRVQDQVHRLDRLVRDLLQYSRPAELELGEHRLADIAREAARQAAVGAELEVVEDTTVRTDAGAVHQVVVNLLQNAREAAGEDAWVGLRVGPGPQLWVMDAGPGVQPNLRDELFEPFVTTKTKGTGLGLAICQRRTLDVGGTLDLYEGPMPWPKDRRRGAVFRLKLPEREG
ncbi:MAG: PAS domain-containing protein [Alphaproteobacteria bacterium]|nr:PAS domain-containing protein [Alphaproteobacteria bacterium]